MRFPLDIHMPPVSERKLTAWGHDVALARDLPAGETTADSVIASAGDAADRVVVSKDRDLLDLHRAAGRPRRLLRVTTGNTPNQVLIAAFEDHLPAAMMLLAAVGVVELNRDGAVAAR